MPMQQCVYFVFLLPRLESVIHHKIKFNSYDKNNILFISHRPIRISDRTVSMNLKCTHNITMVHRKEQTQVLIIPFFNNMVKSVDRFVFLKSFRCSWFFFADSSL